MELNPFMQTQQSNDIREVRGLSPNSYIDPSTFETEKHTIFKDRWCSIGFEESIPNSGDLKPIEFIGQPLIIVRTLEDQVKVFHNACPHRGTQLISDKCNKKLIACPYHAWSFKLNGELRKAPHYEQADPSTFSLQPVRTHVWGGTIFINLSGKAKPFEEMLKPLTQRWHEYDFSLLQSGGALTYDFASNWKLIAENFLECYHVPSVHPKLAQYSKFSDRYPIYFAEEFIGQGSHNYQPSTTKKELPRWPNISPKQEFQAEYVTFFPNTLIGRMPDHVFIWSLEPISPGRTIEHLRFFFIGETSMEGDFEEDRVACLNRWIEVNNEDRDIIQRLYQGHRSSGFSGAKFAPDHEETIYAFQKLVQRSLEGEKTLNRENSMESFDIIKKSHQLHCNPKALRQYYRSWADTYNSDVANEHYVGPQIITSIAVMIAELNSLDQNAAIMDAGCGTGLVGIELSKAGFQNIYGFDISEEMTIKAKKTNKYRSVAGNTNITSLPAEITDISYDLVVCCGVFTVGHVEPEAFINLLGITQPSGHIIFSTRCSYMQETNFEERLESVLELAGARVIIHLRNIAYIAEEGADYWVIATR